MITIMTNLARFNSTLARYMALTSKLPQEALEKQGRNLSVELYKQFSARKWGGPGRARAGLAKAELGMRTAKNTGTRVRASLLKEYAGKRAGLLHDRRYAKWSKNTKAYLRTINESVSLWQSIVGREIGMRQKGIGVLAASFLWFRRRSTQSKGTFYVRNRSGKPLGFAEIADGSFRIVGETEGLQRVDSRFGIVGAAIDSTREGMVQYFREQHALRYREIFREFPA